MAKFTRKLQKLFGRLADAGQIKKFGGFAAADSTDTTDPEVIQSLGEYDEGWFSAVVGDNSPTMEDFNALCYLFAYQLTYLMQTGVAEWNAETTYYIGSLVNDEFGNLYVSLTDDNLNNALTSTANWRITSKRTFTSFAADHLLVTGTDDVVEIDATGADRAVTFPAASTALKGVKFTVVKIDASSNVVSVAFGDGRIKLLPGQYDNLTVLCNGTKWYAI